MMLDNPIHLIIIAIMAGCCLSVLKAPVALKPKEAEDYPWLMTGTVRVTMIGYGAVAAVILAFWGIGEAFGNQAPTWVFMLPFMAWFLAGSVSLSRSFIVGLPPSGLPTISYATYCGLALAWPMARKIGY